MHVDPVCLCATNHRRASSLLRLDISNNTLVRAGGLLQGLLQVLLKCLLSGSLQALLRGVCTEVFALKGLLNGWLQGRFASSWNATLTLMKRFLGSHHCAHTDFLTHPVPACHADRPPAPSAAGVHGATSVVPRHTWHFHVLLRNGLQL